MIHFFFTSCWIFRKLARNTPVESKAQSSEGEAPPERYHDRLYMALAAQNINPELGILEHSNFNNFVSGLYLQLRLLINMYLPDGILTSANL